MKSSIPKWAESDRPREKMMTKGPMSLSEVELLAILIASGNREESAVDLSKRIFADCNNNLAESSGLDISELMLYKGIGEAKAVTITAALELGRRRRETEAIVLKQITNSKIAYNYIYSNIAELSHEEFWIILLKTNKQIIGKKLIGVGGLSSTVADPKKILGRVLARDVGVGYLFREDDFLPAGTREGVAGGVPAGKLALAVPPGRISGLQLLKSGDRFDLLATMPVDLRRELPQLRVGLGQDSIEGRDRLLGSLQRRATVQVIAEDAALVSTDPQGQFTVAVAPRESVTS